MSNRRETPPGKEKERRECCGEDVLDFADHSWISKQDNLPVP
jgi:hypothetical protein